MFSAEDYFVGERYIRFDDEIGRDDEAVMPLYDVNGFIAGLQVAVRELACYIVLILYNKQETSSEFNYHSKHVDFCERV